MDKVEVRAVIKYFFKKGMSLKEIHDDFIKTLWDESPSDSTVKKWAAEFRRRGRAWRTMNPQGTLKRLLTTCKNNELVHSLILCDRRRSLCDIARQIGISFGTVQSVLTNILEMSKVSATWVPRILTKDQKNSRLDISKYFLSLC